MAAVDYRIDDLGIRNEATAAISSGTPVKAIGSNSPTHGRKAINLCNHSTTDGVRVRLSTNATTAPTIDSTHFDFRIAPGDNKVIAAGATVVAWMISESSSNTCAVTFVELL